MKFSSLFLLVLVALQLVHFALCSSTQGGGVLTNKFTVVDSSAPKSSAMVKGKEGNEGSKESTLESEDYIYTQSLP
ncbi:hypothetical protein ACP275_08G246500 [Erythranthe tilingii]